MTPTPPTSTLFPYTTLFRSGITLARNGRHRRPRPHDGQFTNQKDHHKSIFLGLAFLRGDPDVDKRLESVKDDAWLRLLLRSEEHTSELQSRFDLVCRLLLEK